MTACVATPFPNPFAPAGNPPLTKIVLRQAEERTQLVVDCAGLVRRLEQLDAEIAEYDQWQRYPDARYKTNVQIRFEEAREREAAELAKRHGGEFSVAGQMPLRSLRGQGARPISLRPSSPRMPAGNPQEEQEQKLAVAHLQRALSAADFEAGVWRQRAQEMELANEHEREQARRLMEFELSSAMKAAEEDRARLVAELRDRDAAFEKMDTELRTALSARDEQQQALQTAQRHLSDQEEKHRRLANDVASKHAKIESMQAELHQSQRSAQSDRSNADRLEQTIRTVTSELARTQRNLEAAQVQVEAQRTELLGLEAELQSTQEACDVKTAQLAAVQKDLQMVHGRLEAQRKHCEELQAEMQEAQHKHSEQMEAQRRQYEQMQEDCNMKHDAWLAAQKKAELLNAKCENLLAALENSTLKQADAAIERDAQKERADRLVREMRRNLEGEETPESPSSIGSPTQQKQFYEVRVIDTTQPVSLASTMASGTGFDHPTSDSSPERGALPAVRPPSSARVTPLSPKERRDLAVAPF
eukprot:TRINITY_DN109466_c0_g1_i1.p1 TRINITY_DN109466_c0_g1~~TRINITY_DN109466_c0_g1_i1.p1  ORF type:complete len:531 (-),score=124.21 TRINITY_DN109466_c0_g1_i1:118-1710(-)